MEGDAAGLVSNAFGSVGPDRIRYMANKSWFGGGVLEELPIRHVTMIRIETRRNLLLGTFLALAGLAGFAMGDAGMIGGIVLLAGAGLVFWGAPTVTVNTAGGDTRPAAGWPWQYEEANSFVKEVRKALFESTGQTAVPSPVGPAPSLVGGSVIPLAPNGPVPTLASVVDDDGSSEERFWDSMQDKTDPDLLEEFLIRFPDGKFSKLAKTRLARLGIEPIASGPEPKKPPKGKSSATKQVLQPTPAEVGDLVCCPACGSHQEPRQKFCTDCGLALDTGQGEHDGG